MTYDDKIDEIAFYSNMGIRILGFLEGQLKEHNNEVVTQLINSQKGALKLLDEYKGNLENLENYRQEQEAKGKEQTKLTEAKD